MVTPLRYLPHSCVCVWYASRADRGTRLCRRLGGNKWCAPCGTWHAPEAASRIAQRGDGGCGQHHTEQASRSSTVSMPHARAGGTVGGCCTASSQCVRRHNSVCERERACVCVGGVWVVVVVGGTVRGTHNHHSVPHAIAPRAHTRDARGLPICVHMRAHTQYITHTTV